MNTHLCVYICYLRLVDGVAECAFLAICDI